MPKKRCIEKVAVTQKSGCSAVAGVEILYRAGGNEEGGVERKKEKRKKRKTSKAETIKRLSPMSKYYYFSHSRASSIQKFFSSANHGGSQYFSVFHSSSTLKSIS